MDYYYGEDNLMRILNEADFWKHQEAEHTVVIEQIVPDLEPDYLTRLREFKQLFEQTRGQVTQLTETVIRNKGVISNDLSSQIINLIYYSVGESQEFVSLLNEIIRESTAVEGDVIAITVINHIIRESEYYTGIAQTILYKQN